MMNLAASEGKKANRVSDPHETLPYPEKHGIYTQSHARRFYSVKLLSSLRRRSDCAVVFDPLIRSRQ